MLHSASDVLPLACDISPLKLRCALSKLALLVVLAPAPCYARPKSLPDGHSDDSASAMADYEVKPATRRIHSAVKKMDGAFRRTGVECWTHKLAATLCF
jgi:hypothetical protein